MTMEKIQKYYRERYNGKSFEVVIRWAPEFLTTIKHRFGLDSEFISNDLIDLFSHIFSGNAARLKLSRMYKSGWFRRRLTPQGYAYSFSEASRKYCRTYGGFDSGPLIWSNEPKVIEKPVNIKREYVSSDTYLGEL